MTSDVLSIDGHAYSWRRICNLRRRQLEDLRAARGRQPALFEMHEDHRPAAERCGASRYTEPSLLDWARRGS